MITPEEIKTLPRIGNHANDNSRDDEKVETYSGSCKFGGLIKVRGGTALMKIGDYLEFLYNPDNIGKCSICPEAYAAERDTGAFGQTYKCQQYNCWVRIHCGQ